MDKYRFTMTNFLELWQGSSPKVKVQWRAAVDKAPVSEEFFGYWRLLHTSDTFQDEKRRYNFASFCTFFSRSSLFTHSAEVAVSLKSSLQMNVSSGNFGRGREEGGYRGDWRVLQCWNHTILNKADCNLKMNLKADISHLCIATKATQSQNV